MEACTQFIAARIIFLKVVEMYPWLEYFEGQGCSYCRRTAHLHMTGPLPKRIDLITKIRKAFPLVTKLTFRWLSMENDSLVLALGEQFGHTLTELTLSPNCSQALEAATTLLLLCPFLKRFVLEYSVLSNNVLILLANNCKHLQYFKWGNDDYSVKAWCATISDAGMIALFMGCPLLEEIWLDVTPKLTYITLEAFVRMKLKLRRIVWKRKMVFSELDVERFRTQAREQQLIPVPQLMLNF